MSPLVAWGILLRSIDWQAASCTRNVMATGVNKLKCILTGMFLFAGLFGLISRQLLSVECKDSVIVGPRIKE